MNKLCNYLQQLQLSKQFDSSGYTLKNRGVKAPSTMIIHIASRLQALEEVRMSRQITRKIQDIHLIQVCYLI